MIIVGGDAINLFSSAAEIVICVIVYFVIALRKTTVIEDFHSENAFDISVFVQILFRPCRVTEACKEALGAGFCNRLVYVFVAADIVRCAGIFLLFPKIGVTGRNLICIIAGQYVIVLILCVKADVYERRMII